MTILQALDRYYDRMAARKEVVAPGYSTEPIGFLLVLGLDGSLVAVNRQFDASGKRPKPERVPKWFGRQGTGSTPFFLWDNTAYALGVSDKEPGKTARDHAAFKQLHLDVLSSEEDQGLKAIRLFLETWIPDKFASPPFDEKLLRLNLAFRLDGENRLVHERPAAGAHVERLRVSGNASSLGFCLVTGRRERLVRLHPKIKGVDGTAAADVPLVSFNASAFESYGNEQGANAPTSEAAAFRYGAALNRMLERDSRNRLRRAIGDTTVVFWADTSGVGEKAAEVAEDFIAEIFDPPLSRADPKADMVAAAELRRKLMLFAEARPVKEIDPRLEPNTRFHILGLAPNAARLSVRFWIVDDFAALGRRLAQHHADLAIEPPPRGATKPPSVQYLLVKTTALQGKFENIPHQLAGEVTRSVLTGMPYPRTLLSATVMRLRAGDDPGLGWHAAVIKACINRALGSGFSRQSTLPVASATDQTEKEELPVALDPTYQNAAYQLGRLFAVLESAQYAALGRVNAPIGDRYYAAASATPARVFGPLLRGLKHHVSDARKQRKGHWIEGRVGEIMLMLPPDLPKTLRLEDQGRFAVGYYHERATRQVNAVTASEEETNDD